MPHNLYLHSALVLSRKINNKSYKRVADTNIYNAIESSLSLMISFFINFTVLSTFAFYQNSHNTEGGITLYNAGTVLESTFGPYAKYIWAIGLLASG